MKASIHYIKFIAICTSFLVVTNGMTSPQSPDLIIYKGDTFAIYSLILEEYLDIVQEDNIEGKLFGLSFRGGASLNCWRGYQAIYQIEKDSLFLTHILSCNELYYQDSINTNRSRKKLKNIFGDKVINNKVFIDWYSGKFSIPNGDLLRWDGVFYKSFENEILIEVNKGIIDRTLEIENYIDNPKKINRRYNDTISNVIFKEFKRLNWKKLDQFDCAEKYLITINEEGRINEIKMTDYEDHEIEEFWKKREYNYCLRKLLKSLKHIEFDIIKERGRIIKEHVYVEIWYEEDTKELENWTN